MFSYFDALTGSHSDEGKAIRSRFDGWSLEGRDPYVIQSLLSVGEWLYRYYFRVTTDGWHHIPTEGSMLIVGSHNGGMIAPDTLMFMVDWFRQFGPERPVYGLMHPNVWMVPIYARLTVQLGAVKAHPKMAIAALRRGAAVLVYPGGLKIYGDPTACAIAFTLVDVKGSLNWRSWRKYRLCPQFPRVPMIL